MGTLVLGLLGPLQCGASFGSSCQKIVLKLLGTALVLLGVLHAVEMNDGCCTTMVSLPCIPYHRPNQPADSADFVLTTRRSVTVIGRGQVRSSLMTPS